MCSSNPIDWFFPGAGTAAEETADAVIPVPEMPQLPQLPNQPQREKEPDLNPLRNRRNNRGAGFGVPMGSTLLTSPSGISTSSYNLGRSTLLGGG